MSCRMTKRCRFCHQDKTGLCLSIVSLYRMKLGILLLSQTTLLTNEFSSCAIFNMVRLLSARFLIFGVPNLSSFTFFCRTISFILLDGNALTRVLYLLVTASQYILSSVCCEEVFYSFLPSSTSLYACTVVCVY